MNADFDRDARKDLVVYRPATGQWFIRYSSLDYDRAQFGYFQWGAPGDTPISGDFDGDGFSDVVVYRGSTGHWLIRYSSLGYAVSSGMWNIQWGASKTSRCPNVLSTTLQYAFRAGHPAPRRCSSLAYAQ